MPATATKGSRYRATDGRNAVVISKPDHLHHSDAPFEAVRALARKARHWQGWCFVCGQSDAAPDLYVYVPIGRGPQALQCDVYQTAIESDTCPECFDQKVDGKCHCRFCPIGRPNYLAREKTRVHHTSV